MVLYRNGYVPRDVLVSFGSGTDTYGFWEWLLPVATYQRHLALVARAIVRTGRRLMPSPGYSCYRPYAFQVIYKRVHGAGAATPGQSSHGGTFGNRDAMAIDYGNWSWVYGGNRAAFYADVRAVGLTPGIITQPDEPWHVIDYNPWSASSGGGGGSIPSGGFLMALTDQQQQELLDGVSAIYAAIYGPNGSLTSLPQKNNLPTQIETIRQATGLLQTYVYAGSADVKNGIGSPDSIFGKVLKIDAKPAPTVAITDAQIKAIADAVAAQIPEAGTVVIDYERIATEVRDQFRTDPLK